MAYRQKNPLNKNYSPLNNVMALARGVKKAVQDINDNPRIDPSFNPKYDNRFEVVDEQGRSGDDISGGYAGYKTDRFGGIYAPSGSNANLYRTGDVYANNIELQRAMRFDPESGYSPRLLDIDYNKTKSGRPYEAYIGETGKRYNLTKTKEKEEFERARLKMYENRMDEVNRANAMYELADPEKYLKYYQDERNNLNKAPVSDKPGIQYPWQERLYNKRGAPGSDERADYLRSINERYDR